MARYEMANDIKRYSVISLESCRNRFENTSDCQKCAHESILGFLLDSISLRTNHMPHHFCVPGIRP